MTELFSLNLQDIKNELFDSAKGEGIADQEAFRQFAQLTIEEHRKVSELDDDQNLEGMEDVLEALWSEYEQFIQN